MKPFLSVLVAALLILLLATPLPLWAQTAAPAPSPAQPPLSSKGDVSTPAPKKQTKPRSAAQQKNDERMRACGKEWREAKAANKTGGKTWREFSTECRKKKKAGG